MWVRTTRNTCVPSYSPEVGELGRLSEYLGRKIDQILGGMLLLPLLLLMPLVLGAPYEPGNPGAPWTEHELLVGGL